MSDAARRLLLDAADLIEEKGLAKGGFFEVDGQDPRAEFRHPEDLIAELGDRQDFKCCALGALYYVKQNIDRHHATDIEEATRLLAEFIGVVSYDVPEWNDDPSRTKAQVVKALREAAERQEV